MAAALIRCGLLAALLTAWTAPLAAQDPQRNKTGKPPASKQLDKNKNRVKQAPVKSDKSAKSQKPGGKEKGKLDARRRQTVTPAQEAAVLALVRQHHPEVEALLEQLKKAGKPQYVSAIRALFRTSVRLAVIQEKDMERYDLELKRWKLESQAKLLALKVCRAKGEERDRYVSKLNEAAGQLRATQIALVTLDRDRKREELQALERRIDDLSRDRETQVESDVEHLLRSARNLVNASKRRPKPDRRPDDPAEVGAPKKNKTKAPKKDAT